MIRKRLMSYLCFHRGRGRGGRRREGGSKGSQSASTHNLVGCGVVSGGSSLAALEAWQSQGSVWRGLRGSRQTGAPLKSLCVCTLHSYTFKISLNSYTWCILDLFSHVRCCLMTSVLPSFYCQHPSSSFVFLCNFWHSWGYPQTLCSFQPPVVLISCWRTFLSSLRVKQILD